jgi:DNA-directed RNA polymerase specialized sigma24 family protein
MSDRTDDLLNEIVKLLVFNLRQGASTQAEAISTLTQVGIAQDRIAELLGTSVATVRSAQHRAKKVANG